jgi:signal transduction histidine kinase
LASFILTFSGKNLLKLPVYDIIFYLLKKRSLLLAACVLFYSSLLAQQEKIDSLELIVKNSAGLEKYDPLISLVRQYAAVSDNNTAHKLAVEARQIAMHFGDTAKIVNSGRMVGQLLNRLSRAKEAEAILLETLPIARRNDRSEYKNISNNLALAYTVQAKYDKALDLNFKTLVLREEDNEEHEINVSLNNIGFVYFKMKNYTKALEYFDRALILLERAGEHYFLDRLLINIGLCHNHLADYDKAQVYFDRAFKECGANCADQIKIEGGFGLGVANFGRKNYQEAIRHFKESYDIAKRIENTRFQSENLISLGRVYVQLQQSELALETLNECEKVSSEFGYNELLIGTYKSFADLFNQLKNYEKAAHYQRLYINLKDSIYSEVLIENLAKIQTNFAERENLKTIADKEEIIQRQRSLNFAIVIIAILATLLIFVLYRSNRVKKKVNQALSDAKAIIEDQNRQLLSSNYNLDRELKEKNTELEKANESLSRVNEELDNFIYKTSHDIRGPLASLKGMCNVALMDVKDQLALNYLKKLDITAEKLNTILTRLLIVNQINNSALGSEKIDFEGIVTDVLQLEKKKGLPPRLKIKKHIDDAIDFYSDKEFVRIILENLIDNAIKFYNDSDRIDPFVDISITEEEQHVKIKVIDNGIGISEVHPDKIFQMFSRASERSETGGIGLYITKTATEKLGGSVHLKTSPEGFTEFFVKLPLASSRVLA